MKRRLSMGTMGAGFSEGPRGRFRVVLALLVSLVATVAVPGLDRAAYGSDSTCGALNNGVHEISLESQLREAGRQAVGNPCGSDGQYRLLNNITLTSNWSPISGFTGVFDGNNKTIRDLTITQPGVIHQAMFASPNGATITHLTLEDVNISGGQNTAGLISLALGATTVTGVHVTGQVSGSGPNVGGVIGFTSSDSVSVTGATVNATVTSTGSRVGGIVGDLDKGSIANSEVLGSVSGVGLVGGVVGRSGTSGDISFSETSAAVTGDTSQVGGFAGVNIGSISHSHSSGSVTTTGTGVSVGGFVGENQGPITQSSAEGDVDAPGGSEVGGFVGVNRETAGTVTYSFASGSVDAKQNAGGFVGHNRQTIEDSYATGSVTVTDTNAGGFVGRNQFGNAQIRNSYSTGAVSAGGSGAGGFAGFHEEGKEISDSFWDTTTSGIETSSGDATGKTDEEMMTFATFSDAATVGLDNPWKIVDGWSSFDSSESVWGMCALVAPGYPFLLWQYDVNPCVVQSSDDEAAPSGASSEAVTSGGTEPAIHLELRAEEGQAAAGATVLAEGQGLRDGSSYSLVLRSTPVTLASGTVSGDSTFSHTRRLPSDLAPGAHTLTLIAVGADGRTLSLVTPFVVTDAGVLASISSEPVGGVDLLAATGPGVGQVTLGLVSGLALLLIGVAASLSARRAAFTRNGLRGSAPHA